MIVIKAAFQAKPGKVDELKVACQAMATATHAEPTNISYTFSSDLADPTWLHLFEEWETEEGLAEHFATPHMADFITALGELLDGGAPTTKYVVSSFGPL